MKRLLISLFTGGCFLLISAAPPTDTDTLKSTSGKYKPYKGSATRNNDILHTRLDVKFNWEKSEMEGKATITAKTYFGKSNMLYLNARGMDIKSLEVFDLGKNKNNDLTVKNSETPENKKLDASYVYENDSLKINLGREFSDTEKYLVKINYVAMPDKLKQNEKGTAITAEKGLYFINPKGEDKTKMPQIWTQGEPQANSAWFPTIDNPNEKMTDEIYMTVDNKYTTLSNGTLADSHTNTDGTRTDHWKMDMPHSPYLVMMAVGEFKKITDNPWNGKEVSYYVEKEYEPFAQAIFGNTPEMIDFFSGILGTPYPWPKYSQIVVRDFVSGAMENTSATLHGDFMVYQNDRELLDGQKADGVIAHELFHQWFGDLVTTESWANLTLNEGFATYGEYLWEEHKNGRDAAEWVHYNSKLGYFDQWETKKADLIRFDYKNPDDMFDANSYNKGGQVLHMLRKYVGDEAFFASLKLYLERNKFKNVEIHHLRLAFEEVTGQDLNWFFNQWYLGKGHPELEISKQYEAAKQKVTLRVKQIQNPSDCPLFTLPVDVDIYCAGRKERHRITISEQEQEFALPCAAVPELVNFDAERQLLAIKRFPKTPEEYIYLFNHGTLLGDRSEALGYLNAYNTRNDVYSLFINAAEKDNWPDLRMRAISSLNKSVKDHPDEIKNCMHRIALNDKSNKVRGTALLFLSDNFKDSETEKLCTELLKEKSYTILYNTIVALSRVNPAKALEEAKLLENDKNTMLMYALCYVYSQTGGDANINYFSNLTNLYPKLDPFEYFRLYGGFMKRCTKASSFEQASNDCINALNKAQPALKEVLINTMRENILDRMDALIKETSAKDEKESLMQSRTSIEHKINKL